MPRPASHAAGPACQPAPRACIGLADQRCCQVCPGKLSSQRSSLPAPRRRASPVAALAVCHGGWLSMAEIAARLAAVTGHVPGTCRAGNWRRSAWAACPASAPGGRFPPGAVLAGACTRAVTGARRTGWPANRGYSPLPAAPPGPR
jgi:hypothetical protein